MRSTPETQRSVRRDFFSFIVAGPNFKVDEFLSTSNLAYDEIFRSGEQKPRSCAKCLYETSGFRKSLGDPNLLTNAEQDEIACKYLHSNYDAIADLCRRDDVDEAVLSLSPTLTISPETIIADLSFSPWLLRLAGNLGIELAFGVAPVLTAAEQCEDRLKPGLQPKLTPLPPRREPCRR